MKDQWDYVLNDLEELGDKQLFLKYQCSTDISFLVLLLLPSIISNDHLPNVVLVEIGSEDNSLSSRIELLRRLLVVLFETVEEDWLLFTKSRTQRERRISWFNINPLSFIHRNDARYIIKFSSLWFCFCLWSGCKIFHNQLVTLVLQLDLQELLCCCGSNQSRIYLIHVKFWPRIESCLHSETRS